MLVKDKDAIKSEIKTKLYKFLDEYNQVCTKEKAIHLDKNLKLIKPNFQIGTETKESDYKLQHKDSTIHKSNSKNNSKVEEVKESNTSEKNIIFQNRKKLNIPKISKTGELNKNAMMSNQVSNRNRKNGVLELMDKAENEYQDTFGSNFEDTHEDTCEETYGETNEELAPIKQEIIQKIPIGKLLKSQNKNNLGRKKKSHISLDESIKSLNKIRLEKQKSIDSYPEDAEMSDSSNIPFEDQNKSNFMSPTSNLGNQTMKRNPQLLNYSISSQSFKKEKSLNLWSNDEYASQDYNFQNMSYKDKNEDLLKTTHLVNQNDETTMNADSQESILGVFQYKGSRKDECVSGDSEINKQEDNISSTKKQGYDSQLDKKSSNNLSDQSSQKSKSGASQNDIKNLSNKQTPDFPYFGREPGQQTPDFEKSKGAIRKRFKEEIYDFLKKIGKFKLIYRKYR